MRRAPRALTASARRPHWAGTLTVLALTLSAGSAAALTGLVQDGSTGAAIPGAVVRLQATSTRTVTDADGRFVLPDPLVSGARVVAGAPGYYYAGAPALDTGEVTLALDPVPHDPSAPVPFMEPSECATCHSRQHEEWKTSAMAHAGTNTWVADLYDGSATPGGMGGFVYVRDSVLRETSPASECAACHQPEAFAEDPLSALRPVTDEGPAVTRGVSCLVCHLVRSVDETRPNFPGIYPGVVELNRGALVRFGTLGDADYHAPQRMRAAYQPQLSSVVCGVCHQDRGDPSGHHRFDGPLSEPTYLEWLASPYGDPESPLFQSCMGCHSDPVDERSGSFVLDYTPGRPLGDLRSHRFEGTTARFLEDAVTVALEAEQAGDRLVVRVMLTNHNTGHHVPTGVTMRNMILLVKAEGTRGPLVHLGDERVSHLAGVGDPQRGYFAGLPGKLYANVNRAADGSSPVMFTEATETLYDNRLPALATDRTEYSFRVENDEAVRVSAQVIYRRAFRDIVDAKGWKQDGHGRPLADLAAPHFGHLMAEAEATVEVRAERASTGWLGGGGCTVSSVSASAPPQAPRSLAWFMGFGVALGGAWRRRAKRS